MQKIIVTDTKTGRHATYKWHSEPPVYRDTMKSLNPMIIAEELKRDESFRVEDGAALANVTVKDYLARRHGVTVEVFVIDGRKSEARRLPWLGWRDVFEDFVWGEKL